MTHIDVFDPPMCCSTGVCGPSVDPRLAAFAAEVDWLRSALGKRTALELWDADILAADPVGV